MDDVPDLRVRTVTESEVSSGGQFVLYWMTSFRRGQYNFSLQRAVQWAKKLGKPLVILEALRCDYQWASDRLHRFVIEGMADNANHFAAKNVLYYPYVEPSHGAGKGLLKALASRAALVISDDFPCFFLPRMIDKAAIQVPVRFELVDSNGLLPMRAAAKVFARAYDFRRFLQKHLLPHLADVPQRDPLSQVKLPTTQVLPVAITSRWPMADLAALLWSPSAISSLPINHEVSQITTVGGSLAARSTLMSFLDHKLPIYGTHRNRPETDATSGLSPYLHFGHISAHHVFEELARRAEWTPDRVAGKANGSSDGWWGATEEVESFLDELITWRELGYNMCSQCDDYDHYDSLPEWAQKTLTQHADDHRPYLYSLQQFETSQTHDPLWNAAQSQLVREGCIHNYLRMLWGKKILQWSSSPREALDIMIELNNRYALDGRNPNSYSGIFWVLGRYDRAWGPERQIFGKIRYMSSKNTARKVKVKNYIERYSSCADQRQLVFG